MIFLIFVDLAIVGGGSAGMAAACAAKKSGIKKVVILEQKPELGGVLNQCIHNGFGLHYFKNDLTGPEYAEKFIEYINKNNDIHCLINTTVLEINSQKVITAVNSQKGIFRIKPKAIILAMGCREKSIESLMIPGDRPAGIFTAGCVQELINRKRVSVGKKAVILGSGDIGLIMARRLTLNGTQVQVVLEIAEKAGGLERNIEQCLNDFSIPLLTNTTVVRIVGKNRLKKVVVADVDKNKNPIYGTEKEIECDTLVSAVGLIPDVEIVKKSGILFSNQGQIIVGENLESSIKGIFVCGNVLKVHGLVDDVSLEGLKAGQESANYIMQNKTNDFKLKSFEYNIDNNEPKADFFDDMDKNQRKQKKQITCILCPKSCNIIGVFYNKEIKVWGNNCKKGYDFFFEEIKENKRILTAVIPIDSKVEKTLPVRSEKPVRKNLLMDLVKELKNYSVKPPIKMGDIVLDNLLNKNINIVATRSIEK